jgi:RND family efflux transporter MFP subunit
MPHSVRCLDVTTSTAFALLALTLGCTRADHAQSDHGHPHGPGDPGRADEAETAPEQTLASLGERYLVHLIHPTFVSGARVEILLHGTRRDEGSPITGGEVALVARSADGKLVRIPTHERIPGHWPGEGELPTAGRWTLAVDVRSAAGNEVIDIGAVEVHPDAAAASKAPIPGPTPGVIPFLFEQQWPVAMQFERVAPRPLFEWLMVNGRVAARPGGEAHVSAPVAGRILAPEKGELPRPGDRVAAGDVLGYVEPHLGTSELVALQALEYQQHQLRHELDLQQLEAERALGSARVRIQAGTREVERAERLVAATLATEQELDKVRADLALSRAEETAALASLASVNKLHEEHAEDPGTKAPRLPLVAPITGILAEVDAVLGESVEQGASLAVVLDLETVWAIAEVPESRFATLDAVAGARFRGTGDTTAVEVTARPVRVAPRVDQETRTVDVAYAVPNASGALRVGMLLSCELKVRDLEDALSVPVSALVYERGQPLVYALVDGESMVKRHLKLGLRDGDRVQVLEGLAAGDSIVATRPDEVRLAALSGSGGIVEHQH